MSLFEITQRNRSLPLNQVQKELIVTFLAEHPDLQKEKYTCSFTKTAERALWGQLAERLNTVDGGSKKTWQQWRKAWQDMRKQTIKKRSALKKSAISTGGGPPHSDTWSTCDEAVTDLLCETVISGDTKIVESMPTFQFDTGIELTAPGPSVPVMQPYPPMCNVVPLTPQVPNAKTPVKTSKRKRLEKSQTLSSAMVDMATENLALKRRKLDILEKHLTVQQETLGVQKKIFNTKDI